MKVETCGCVHKKVSVSLVSGFFVQLPSTFWTWWHRTNLAQLDVHSGGQRHLRQYAIRRTRPLYHARHFGSRQWNDCHRRHQSFFNVGYDCCTTGKGPSVITDICEKTKRVIPFEPLPLPQNEHVCLYTGPIFSGDEPTSIHIWRFFGPGEAIVSEAKRRAQHMIIITCTRLACCTCKTEVACRTRARRRCEHNCDSVGVGRVGASKLDESAAHWNPMKVLRELAACRSLTKVLCIEAWRKCCAFCASRAPIFFQETNLAKTPSPNDAFSFFRKYR